MINKISANELTLIISIVGIIGNVFVANKTLKGQIRKKKTEISIDKLIEINDSLIAHIYDTMKMKSIEDASEEAINDYLGKWQRTINIILTYGKNGSIRIVSEIQKQSYSKMNSNEDDFVIVVLMIILLAQLRYEVTGNKTNPSYYYNTLFRKADNIKSEYKVFNNSSVKKLKLKKFLLM